jgi:hypothetical protein
MFYVHMYHFPSYPASSRLSAALWPVWPRAPGADREGQPDAEVFRGARCSFFEFWGFSFSNYTLQPQWHHEEGQRLIGYVVHTHHPYILIASPIKCRFGPESLRVLIHNQYFLRQYRAEANWMAWVIGGHFFGGWPTMPISPLPLFSLRDVSIIRLEISVKPRGQHGSSVGHHYCQTHREPR